MLFFSNVLFSGSSYLGKMVDGGHSCTGSTGSWRFAHAAIAFVAGVCVPLSLALHIVGVWSMFTLYLRLRAAVFINACAMRDAVNLRQGPLLTSSNLQKLETSNYLFHSALNWLLVGGVSAVMGPYTQSLCCTTYYWTQGLAQEALVQNRLLWKVRPKLHKLLECNWCVHACVCWKIMGQNIPWATLSVNWD